LQVKRYTQKQKLFLECLPLNVHQLLAHFLTEKDNFMA
jgi:hypothetical protein